MYSSLIASLIARVHGKVKADFVQKLMAPANNHKTIMLITNSIRICIIHYLYVGKISRGLLKWKTEMHMTF